MNYETEINKLKQTIEAAKSKKIRAEMEAEQAKEQIDVMQTKLKEKFQVESVEEAQELIGKLQLKLETSIQTAQSEIQKLSI